MKFTIRNIVKLYGVSNIIFDKMYTVINNEIITTNNSNIYDNNILISLLLVISFQILKPNFILSNKTKKIISMYSTFYYNRNVNRYIDFIIILFIFIFFREIKNAI